MNTSIDQIRACQQRRSIISLQMIILIATLRFLSVFFTRNATPLCFRACAEMRRSSEKSTCKSLTLHYLDQNIDRCGFWAAAPATVFIRLRLLLFLSCVSFSTPSFISSPCRPESSSYHHVLNLLISLPRVFCRNILYR